MTHPAGGGSAPIGADPTAAFPSAPPGGLPPHPVTASAPPLVPVAPVAAAPVATAPAASGAVPLTPRDRDSRDTGERTRRKAPLAWLPWALLAALLGLLALMLLAGTLAGADRATSSGARSGGAGAAGAGASSGGTLTSGGVDLLADRQSLGRLGSLQGQEAIGRGVTVQSVVADEGFWVGPSAAQRTFVFLTPEARQSAGESGFQVRQGQRVDLNGTVTGTSPGDDRRFGVTDTEGARQLLAQRAYVRATQVRLTQQ